MRCGRVRWNYPTSLRHGDASSHADSTAASEGAPTVDFVSMLTLQGRSRSNALRATQRLGRRRRDAAEAQRAVTAAAATSPDLIDTHPDGASF